MLRRQEYPLKTKSWVRQPNISYFSSPRKRVLGWTESCSCIPGRGLRGEGAGIQTQHLARGWKIGIIFEWTVRASSSEQGADWGKDGAGCWPLCHSMYWFLPCVGESPFQPTRNGNKKFLFFCLFFNSLFLFSFLSSVSCIFPVLAEFFPFSYLGRRAAEAELFIACCTPRPIFVSCDHTNFSQFLKITF